MTMEKPWTREITIDIGIKLDKLTFYVNVKYAVSLHVTLRALRNIITTDLT